MEKKLFANLVESIQQHNEIISGTRKSARVTKVDAHSIKVLRAKAGSFDAAKLGTRKA